MKRIVCLIFALFMLVEIAFAEANVITGGASNSAKKCTEYRCCC